MHCLIQHINMVWVFVAPIALMVTLILIMLPNVRFAETGEALVSSVDKIIFVGSPGVGRMV